MEGKSAKINMTKIHNKVITMAPSWWVNSISSLSAAIFNNYSLINEVFMKGMIITKDVYIVDKFNISNHNKLFFWSQNSNKNISFPISNNM